MRIHHIWALAAVFCVACGGKAVVDGSGGAGGAGTSSGQAGSGTSPSSSGTGTSPMCTSFVPCCDVTGSEVDYLCDANGEPYCPPGSMFPASGSCEGSPPPPLTLCFDVDDCDRDEWCDFPDDLCGDGVNGTCKARPEDCPDQYLPTCTCGGNVASNPCDGRAGGQDVDVSNACTPPLDTFKCGSTFCAVGTQYCQRQISDVGGEPDFYSCESVPGACSGSVTCACLSGEPCGSACNDTGGDAVTLTCPGG